MKTAPLKIVVVGAGVGGLAAALRLAAQGHAVTVLEAGPRVGGKLNILQRDGFRFDTGPSLLTLPWVFEELFANAGERLDAHLKLVRLEPMCRYVYPDGTGFDASSDLPTMMGNLEQFSAGSGEDFMAFYGHAARAWRGSRKAFLESRIASPLDFVRHGVPWQDLGALLPWPSLHGVAQRFFKDPRLWPFVGRYATYTGSSPYQAPGTLSTVAFSEYAFGAWHIEGGLYRLAEVLRDLCVARGAKIRLGCAVKRIVLQEGRATGVLLEDGTEISADAVVSNADAAHLYGDLLPATFDARSKNLEPSLSGFVLMLGVQGQTPSLAHHNIFFGNNYPLEFKRIFENRLPAEDPTVYVCIASKTDAELAPPDHENWFVLVNAPATGRVNWDTEREPYTERILKILEERVPGLRARIRTQDCLTPSDLEQRYRTWHGGIYGSSSNGAQSAFLRPQNVSGSVRGLYLASGSAHPGGGLPLVCLSAKLAVEALLQDHTA